MRAVLVEEHGELDAAQLQQVSDPVPQHGEVLVRIQAVAVNFVDLLVIKGGYQFLPPRPFVPGKLPVGTVEAVSAGVQRFKKGDRVQTMAEHGGYAELVAVGEDQCIALPDELGFAEAAAMSLAYDTAWFALRDRARIQSGETVLVLGATGSVGHAAVQLAKAMGARVIAGVFRPESDGALRPAGADELVFLAIPDLQNGLRDQVRALTGGAGADIILDPLGGDVFDAAIRALAWRGRLVVIGFASGRIPVLKANYLLLKNIEVSGLQVSDYRKRAMPEMHACYDDIYRMYKDKMLAPGPMRQFPLDRFSEALRLIADRKAAGRLILAPNGPAAEPRQGRAA